MKLKIPPTGDGGDAVPTASEEQAGSHLRVGRDPGQRGDPRSRKSSATWSWGPGQVLSLPGWNEPKSPLLGLLTKTPWP